MSNAFDKAWHAVLIYKLKSGGIIGDLLRVINKFLNNRFQ